MALVTLWALVGVLIRVRTDDGERRASARSFAWVERALVVGAVAGLGAAYLARPRDGLLPRDLPALGVGAALGALAGAGLGLGLTVSERIAHWPGLAGVALRDAAYGGGLGLVAGALALGDEASLDELATGALLGSFAGMGAGLLVGVAEARALAVHRTTEHAERVLLPPLPDPRN